MRLLDVPREQEGSMRLLKNVLNKHVRLLTRLYGIRSASHRIEFNPGAQLSN